MKPAVPNLELLLYKAQTLLAKDEKFVAAVNAKKDNKQFFGLDFTVEVFPQMWGSTCTGFDVMPDGSPVMSGSAMTEAYTTIIHERQTDCYVVFFGDRACYKVENANQAFFDDKQQHIMASLSVAKNRY